MLFLSHFLADFFASFPSPLSPYFIEYGVDSISYGYRYPTLLSSLSQIFLLPDLCFKNQVQFIFPFSLILPGLIPFSSHIYTLFLILVVAFLANASFHPQGASGESGSQGITLFVSGGIAGAALGLFHHLDSGRRHIWNSASNLGSGHAGLFCFDNLEKRDYNISSSIPRQKFSFSFSSLLLSG